MMVFILRRGECVRSRVPHSAEDACTHEDSMYFLTVAMQKVLKFRCTAHHIQCCHAYAGWSTDMRLMFLIFLMRPAGTWPES